MEHSERIEKYVTNRMGREEASAFEEDINNSPQLKASVALQRSLIEGLKRARVRELKTMLSTVQVGGISRTTIGKAALAIFSAGVVGTILYFNIRMEKVQEPQPISIELKEPIVAHNTPPPSSKSVDKISKREDFAASNTPPSKTPKKSALSGKKNIKNSNAIIPPIPPQVNIDDSVEKLTSDTEEGFDGYNSLAQKRGLTSYTEVDIDATHTKYSFHYQFTGKRLTLYGQFSPNLYEIIEIKKRESLLFLYYKDKYYSLDKSGNKILPLKPIENNTLSKKLDLYRRK